MPDDIKAFKAALAQVMALADRALDARLTARKPKPAPVAEPEVEMEGGTDSPEEELSEDDKRKLAEMYGSEE